MAQSPPQPLPYELLIFDWDGTLIDSIGTIVACTQAAVTEIGLHPLEEQAIRQTVGLGLKETAEALLPGSSETTFIELREAYFRHWVETYAHQPLLFEGVPEILETLKSAGYLLAVATGKSRRGLERDMGRVGQREHFAATRTVDEAPSKPHPGMILDLLDELGVTAERALMVGDTSYDLMMAKAADCSAVGVGTGSQSCQQLAEHQPLACMPSVSHLPEWLAGQRSG